jgi:hypothetical protein
MLDGCAENGLVAEPGTYRIPPIKKEQKVQSGGPLLLKRPFRKGSTLSDLMFMAPPIICAAIHASNLPTVRTVCTTASCQPREVILISGASRDGLVRV